MFGMNNKRRLEEDLEKIRVANLPDDERAELEAAKEKDLAEGRAKVEKLGFKDYLAMVIAAVSLILPYVLFIFGAMAVVVLLFWLFF